MFHLAVVNRSRASDLDVAFWVEACRWQLQQQVAPLWGSLAGPVNVFFYASDAGIPDRAAVVWILDDAGKPGLAGYHTVIGRQPVGAVDLSRSSVRPSVTLSHELAEMCCNLWLDNWDASDEPGLERAREVCDPVNLDELAVEAQILDQRRTVPVANVLGPAYFGIGSGPLDLAGRVRAPGELRPGGYQIERRGRETIIRTGPAGATFGAWQLSPLSRTNQLLRGLVLPPEGA